MKSAILAFAAVATLLLCVSCTSAPGDTASYKDSVKKALEQAELYVDPRCKDLIRDFEEITYKPESGVIDKEGDAMRTHLSDALGYLIWQECRALPPFGEQSRRLF